MAGNGTGLRGLAAAAVLSIGLAAGTAPGAAAGEHAVVVELYTSQGCSSCPPADALLGELAMRDDVIPLALHVDYWDYIGWVDRFADPAHADRQRGYVAAIGKRTIYTPQMIVGGLHHVVGTRPGQLERHIRSRLGHPPHAEIALARRGDTVSVSIPPMPGLRPSELHLVRYTPRERVRVRAGENAGRTLTYHNVVKEFRTLGPWDGSSPFSLDVEAAGDDPVVVLLQQAGHGPILAAARLR